MAAEVTGSLETGRTPGARAGARAAHQEATALEAEAGPAPRACCEPSALAACCEAAAREDCCGAPAAEGPPATCACTG
jgi:hypothetical protein